RDAGYPIEITGQWSTADQGYLARASVEHNIRQPKWSEWLAKSKLRLLRKRSASVLIMQESFESERSRKRGYGALGIDSTKYLGPKGCLVWRPGDKPIRELNQQFDFIWISGFLEQSSSGLLIVLREGTESAAFSPHHLSEIIASSPSRVRPMVFLDIPD